MGTFELLLPGKAAPLPEAAEQGELGSAVLIYNALWFTKVRWLVAGIFVIVGTIGRLIPETLHELGLAIPSWWLWALAAGLAAANVPFGLLVGRFTRDSPRQAVKGNLYEQIAVDLLAVTLLVHAIGSTQTFIAFIYLFHIALACVFFPKRESLLVTIVAATLYLSILALETTGIWPSSGITYASGPLSTNKPHLSALTGSSAVFIWLVVWYLASTLSEVVRKRDLQLSVANERLVRADQEKNLQMLLTTHELKVPFAGIESNIEVLKVQYWSEIPEAAREIIDRIDVRAQVLSERINELLLLGNLKSKVPIQEEVGPVDLRLVINTALKNLEPKAHARRITLDVRVPPVIVPGNEEQFIILFSNLLSNAILYSQEGGKVEILANEGPDTVSVFVSDHGIGIRDEALPHIFEEFYRTKEGARFNKMSTGLGLAIVKEIARHFRLRMRVTSEEGKGTTFEVAIMKEGASWPE